MVLKTISPGCGVRASLMLFFYKYILPHNPKGLSGYCFYPWCQMGGWQEKGGPGYISETVSYRKLILSRDIG